MQGDIPFRLRAAKLEVPAGWVTFISKMGRDGRGAFYEVVPKADYPFWPRCKVWCQHDPRTLGEVIAIASEYKRDRGRWGVSVMGPLRRDKPSANGSPNGATDAPPENGTRNGNGRNASPASNGSSQAPPSYGANPPPPDGIQPDFYENRPPTGGGDTPEDITDADFPPGL